MSLVVESEEWRQSHMQLEEKKGIRIRNKRGLEKLKGRE